MSFDSPSFIYKTPEQCRQRISDAVYSIDSEEWLFCNGLSSIMSPCSQSDEQDKNVANSWNGTNLHYRRRNRLETRLEELQKDVDCLSHKLRANVDSSMTLDTSSCLATSRERKNELESFKMSGLVDKRRNGSREQLSETARTVNSTVKALRQLKEVTAEKDQLKLELERTKRALDAAEKKCKNAEKSKKAYDKLKARCDLLQDSLQLSEKIRLRQKKVMKHLQVQQQAKSAKKESEEQKMKNTAGMKTVSRLAKESTFCHKTATPSWQELNARRDTTARKHAHTIYDAMDSCTVSDEEQDKGKKTGLDTHEQAPSKPTAAWRPQNPHSMLKPATQTAIQSCIDRQPHSSISQISSVRSSRIPTNITRPTSQVQVQQRKAMRQAAIWARSRGAAVDISTSTVPKTTRKNSSSARPKNSFLAPTQASLRRVHDLHRRGDHGRPLFVV